MIKTDLVDTINILVMYLWPVFVVVIIGWVAWFEIERWWKSDLKMRKGRLIFALLVTLVVPAYAHSTDYRVGTFRGRTAVRAYLHADAPACVVPNPVDSCSSNLGFDVRVSYTIGAPEGIYVASLDWKTSETVKDLDELKSGDEVRFRATPDRRIGAGKNSFHLYVPKVSDPKKEWDFAAILISK